jgi:protease I
MKKALIIIPQNDFRDEELDQTQIELNRNGIETVLASNFRGSCYGVRGTMAEATVSLSTVNVFPFDAIIFIGGPGAEGFFHNEEVKRLINEAIGLNRIIGAICLAPKILALQGRLSNCQFTSNSAVVKEIISLGGIYNDDDVVVDHNIITSKGPQTASKFGRTIAKELKVRDVSKRTLLDGYNKKKSIL